MNTNCCLSKRILELLLLKNDDASLYGQFSNILSDCQTLQTPSKYTTVESLYRILKKTIIHTRKRELKLDYIIFKDLPKEIERLLFQQPQFFL